MKKIVFLMLCVGAMFSTSYAASSKAHAPAVVMLKEVSIVKLSVNELKEIFALCDVEVTVSVGVGSTHAKATVKAKDVDCNKLVEVIRRLKAQARAALA